ncbi:uncharacterized protein LOC135341084 [Halichondria panicea]|uniref:uncharacterized protein LOC135341084 n=1 Tax=Halichondria panicea TaxID=6063 RepID=UPI00312BAC79
MSMFSSCMLTLPAGQSQRSTFRRSSKTSQSLGSNWNLNKAHKLYFLVILVLSGDIQSNPGPVVNWKYPCGKCNCPVKTNQAGIMCEVCYAWHHCKCVCIDDSEYHRLQLSDEAWCCSSCFRTALPFHDSSTLNSTISSTSCSTSDSISSSLASSHGRDCTIVYTNCRSVLPKMDILRTHAASFGPDVYALTETWLDDSISDIEIFIPDYTIIRRDRNRHGGGVLLYVRESTPVELVTKHPSLELLLVEAKFTNSPTLLGIYYRPPSAGSANLADLECALESLQPSRLSNSILMGDFNIDLSKNSMQMLSHFHLTQVVSEPTRLTDKGSSLIDHVYISDHSLLQSCSTSPPLGSSDHQCISVVLKWSTRPIKRVKRDVWLYSRADWDSVNAELLSDSTTTHSFTDINSALSQWKNSFLSVLSRHIPRRLVSTRKHIPWLTTEIIRLLRRRDCSHSRAKALNTESSWSKFRSLRNRSVAAVRAAKWAFLKSLGSLIKSPKEFWSTYHALSPTKQRIPHTLTNGTITADSPFSKANLLNTHFTSCLSNTTDVLSSPWDAPVSPSLDSISCSPDQVLSLLSRTKLKTASGPDGISSHMLRKTSSSIHHFFTYLFNK